MRNFPKGVLYVSLLLIATGLYARAANPIGSQGPMPLPLFSTASPVDWTAIGPVSTNWIAIATSADGTKVFACQYRSLIYISTNSGSSWTAHTVNSSSHIWTSITTTPDGSKVFVTENPGSIYISSDGGSTWAASTAAGTNRHWSDVAASADGSKILAGVDNGYVYVSTDAGVSWQEKAITNIPRRWSAVASSSDGSRMAAAWRSASYINGTWSYQGRIYLSADYGATWNQQRLSPSLYWTGLASSSDGTKVLATAANFISFIDSPFIFMTTNSGGSWVTNGPIVSTPLWTSPSMSFDGNKIVAANINSRIFISPDGGYSWLSSLVDGAGRNWSGTAVSFDGNIIYCCIDGGTIYRGTYVGADDFPWEMFVPSWRKGTNAP